MRALVEGVVQDLANVLVAAAGDVLGPALPIPHVPALQVGDVEDVAGVLGGQPVGHAQLPGRRTFLLADGRGLLLLVAQGGKVFVCRRAGDRGGPPTVARFNY